MFGIDNRRNLNIFIFFANILMPRHTIFKWIVNYQFADRIGMMFPCPIFFVASFGLFTYRLNMVSSTALYRTKVSFKICQIMRPTFNECSQLIFISNFTECEFSSQKSLNQL